MRYRRFYRRKNSAVFGIVCVLIVLLISLLLVDAKLRPAVYELAALEAYSVSSERVNSAVERILSENAPLYSDLVTVNYSNSNIITGITTDIVGMNVFKSQVTNAIDSEFSESPETEIPISLGTASGVVLFSGLGPKVNIDVGFVSSTKTDFKNVFESAGINQTQHSIMLNVETTVILNLAGRRIPQTVETSFCVAQTVIVGSVPEVTVNK
ncbi:MAG: sporulation protein YunB [Clostridia bacterium]|nr:sporulation protein YunB [Clostridia bacterium]